MAKSWNYVTLCERGEVTYSHKVKDEDFETFVEDTKRGKELKDKFEMEDNLTCLQGIFKSWNMYMAYHYISWKRQGY